MSFFLGVSLFAHAALVGGYRLYWSGMSQYGFSDLMESDYQKTEDFREYIQSKLAVFLAMAAGEDPGDWVYSGYYSTYQWGSPLLEDDYDVDVWWGDVAFFSTGTAEAVPLEVIEEELRHAEEAYMDDMANSAGSTSTSVWQESAFRLSVDLPESAQDNTSSGDYAADVKDSDARNRMDMNLRYRISYEGKELYSNMEDVAWEKPGDALPDGYNFMLCYANGEVTIIKDGEKLDIYGDGIYQNRAQWCLPGYQNLTVDEDLKSAEIVMLVATEPVYYSTQYRNGSYYWSESPLYQIAAQTRARSRRMGLAAWELVVGLVLIIIAFFARKRVRSARLWLGGATGKIWFEAKLLVFVLSVFVTGAVYLYYIWYLVPYTYGFWDGELFYELFYRISQRPLPLLGCLWLWYLLLNDLLVNKKQALDGLTCRLMHSFSEKNLSLSFSKRLVRRFLPILLFTVLPLIAGLCLLCFCMMTGEHWISSDILLVFSVDLLILSGIYLALCCRYLTHTRQQAKELDVLAERIAAIQNGESADAEGWPKDGELLQMAEQLDRIQESMEAAVEARTKSERMKVELVANVSHDIKTPLTSIVSYIEFLKQEEDLPEHVKDYIRILDEKAGRLTLMVQDVFTVSKAVSGQLSVEMKELDFGKLLRQTLADMQEQIAAGSVIVREEIPKDPVMITADGDRLYRVFQNLIENALKYSLDGSRVYITLRQEGTAAEACIKNTSRQELVGDKDFTERFVRGDVSRTDGGSGLGLSIAKSFTEASGGQFTVETDADLFVVRVRFEVDKSAQSLYDK